MVIVKRLSALLLLWVMLGGIMNAAPRQSNAPDEEHRRSFLRGDVLEVNLRNAGTLKEYLAPDEEKRVRCIRLSGVMNGDDAKFIRRICDRSSACDENGRSVDNYVDLELERVRIVGGGGFLSSSEHDAISSSMFSGSSHLRYVSLPRDLRSIGDYAFRGCSNLEEVRFMPRCNVRRIGDEAFGSCYRLSRINLPEGLEEIGSECFYSCSNLRRIDLPSTLLSIGKEAFYNVPLSNVRLPAYLTSLGRNAFKGTNLTSLFIPLYCKVEDDEFGGISKLREFQVERGNQYYTVEDGVLYDATGEILICCPNALKGSFSVPSGVTTLRGGSFAGCALLTSITLPESLSAIGAYAFGDCRSLGNIMVPASVLEIGDDAFSGCKAMTTATIDASISVLSARTFENCSSLQSIVLPMGLVTIGEKAFNDCKALQNVEWGNSLRTIKKEAFKKCGFVQMVLPDGVATVGENAFRDCKSMRTIVLPNSLAVVEKELFRGCENLTLVKLPSQLSAIGDNAFRDCKSLPGVELPNGIRSIGDNAFRGTSLTQLTLPSSIQQLGEKIVEKCKMQGVTCHAVMPPALKKVSEKKTPLYVPAGSIESYKNAKPWKDFKNILPIE